MPIIGFRCCDTAKTRNKGDIPFEDCLECAKTGENQCHFTYPILKGITEEVTSRNYISVTSLLGCTRNTYFTMHNDIYVSPEDLYFLFRGTISHHIIENNQQDNALVEQTFTRKHQGLKLTGTPDVILPEQGKIIDYKTTRSLPRYKWPYSNHTLQLNLYRWLVAEEYDIKELEVQYLDMSGVKRCPAKIKEERTQELLDTKLSTLNACFDIEQPPPKPKPDSPDRWQCNGYCHVSDICEREHEEEIRKAIIQDLRLKG